MIRMTIAVAIAFIFFVIVHFLHFHFFPPVEKVKSVLLVAQLGALFYLGLLWLLPSEEAICKRLRIRSARTKQFIVGLIGLICYGLLFTDYMNFYFTADRSITFRMLRITDEQPAQAVTADEMLQLYDTKSIILRRFDDLVYGGYLMQDENRYRLTPKGRLILSVYRESIDFLHLRKF